MKFQFEKSGFNKIIYFFSFALILFTFACEAPQTTITTNQTVANNAPVSNTSTATAQANRAGSATLPVTLPVLDAM
ncbi:MAG: hypothetical protein M3525_08490, partial [Acidobacteriota bacterium]|nr:hypothetical protein [Acidobacteriota bacterium]